MIVSCTLTLHFVFVSDYCYLPSANGIWKQRSANAVLLVKYISHDCDIYLFLCWKCIYILAPFLYIYFFNQSTIHLQELHERRPENKRVCEVSPGDCGVRVYLHDCAAPQNQHPKNPAWYSIFGVTEKDIHDICYSILRLYKRKKVQ